MVKIIDEIELLKKLISFESIAGGDDAIIHFLQEMFESWHFENVEVRTKIMKFADEIDEVSNLLVEINPNSNLPHFCFAGHVDVVPAGDESRWSCPPFEATEKQGKIFGRGVVDMKGGVACFISALQQFLQENGENCKITLLITGDEEARAVNGTEKMLQNLSNEPKKLFDLCLIGEPSSFAKAVDNVKIGRRGSANFELSVFGKQGHVAYADLCDNALAKLIKILNEFQSLNLDDEKKSEHFGASNLEITNVEVNNSITNIIPGRASCMLNVRFNDLHSGQGIFEKLRQICHEITDEFELKMPSCYEAFVSDFAEDELQKIVDAIADVTVEKPSVVNNGGTSDGRFLHKYAPVIEVGVSNATAHKIDENCEITCLKKLKLIYFNILNKFFNG